MLLCRILKLHNKNTEYGAGSTRRHRLIKIAHLETLINDNHLCTRDQVVDAARTAVESRVKVKRQARLDDFANLSAGEPGKGETHWHVRTADPEAKS